MEPVDGLIDPVDALRLDHVLAAQRIEVRVDLGSYLGRDELGDGAGVELASDHGRALDHRALAGPEALDARREQRLDSRGNRDGGKLAIGNP